MKLNWFSLYSIEFSARVRAYCAFVSEFGFGLDQVAQIASFTFIFLHAHFHFQSPRWSIVFARYTGHDEWISALQPQYTRCHKTSHTQFLPRFVLHVQSVRFTLLLLHHLRFVFLRLHIQQAMIIFERCYLIAVHLFFNLSVCLCGARLFSFTFDIYEMEQQTPIMCVRAHTSGGRIS